MLKTLIAGVVVCAAVAARAEPAVPAAVKVVATGAGWRLTDDSGMALYVTDLDAEDGAGCYAECAVVWPPFEASGDQTGPSLDWSVVAREDGLRQWAFKNRPLYWFARDAYPGATFGDDPSGAWHAAVEPIWTPAEITLTPTLLGVVLADVNALTLYVNEADKVTAKEGVATVASPCTGTCLQTWRPVHAPWAAVASGDWSIVLRSDGTHQLAYRSRPLYAYANDMEPGETRGHDQTLTWRAMVVEPAPPVPDWVTFRASDAGELLADPKGQTIYAFNAAQNQARVSNLSAPATCDAECVRAFWIPVKADGLSAPIGNWSTVAAADGTLQWAYKGEPLYTHARDKEPGDITGTRFTGSKAWHAITRSGRPMQGMGGN
jgi:predicted lipoprotein with Yx(FWY)xxD motif